MTRPPSRESESVVVSIFDYPSARATDQYDRMGIAWEAFEAAVSRLYDAAAFFEEVSGTHVELPSLPYVVVFRAPCHDLPMEAHRAA